MLKNCELLDFYGEKVKIPFSFAESLKFTVISYFMDEGF